MVKYRIPSRYIRVDSRTGTVAVRSKKNGRFKGRRASNKADTTRVIRLIRSYDVNHDGRIGKREGGGQILGRTKSIKATRRARGYIRSI